MEQYRRLGAIALMIGWLLVTALGYWLYQDKVTRPYTTIDSPIGHGELKRHLESAWTTLPGQGEAFSSGPTLIHFSTPQCHCDQQSRQHVSDLYDIFDGTALTLVQATQSYDATSTAMPRAQTIALPEFWAIVPAVPSAALFDASGTLLYFGPYSSGPICGAGINFVEDLLTRLDKGQPPSPWINDMAVGCFCKTGTYST
ncbi:DUF6436 domain-containing protein [Marinobacter sp. LN3S78]|uniref:DUF6436 domain-containing protein n=1 Tax=Marinobacter sp. LN3S78 TaxID=3382300 RepID=UPI00387AB239